MTESYKLGKKHNALGYSIFYNPYRNKGTAKEFADWVKGYNDNNP